MIKIQADNQHQNVNKINIQNSWQKTCNDLAYLQPNSQIQNLKASVGNFVGLLSNDVRY